MIYTFQEIDYYLQRQILKLMKYLEDDKDSKRALYLGYSVIRNHLIDIIYKIKDYYKYHDKLTNLYSINEMYIPGLKPKFIIPELSYDVYETLAKEIKSYINGFDNILMINNSNYNILNDIYYFKEHFAKCCYNSIYYALKELGTNSFSNMNVLVNSLINREFFNSNIGIMDVDSIFDFDRSNKYLFGWNSYKDYYSLTHKEYKKYKKLMYADLYDEDDYNDNTYDGLNPDQTFHKYVKEMIKEQMEINDKRKEEIKKIIKEEKKEKKNKDKKSKKSKKK